MATNWTDDLTAEQVRIRALHFTELQNALKAEMTRRNKIFVATEQASDGKIIKAKVYNEMVESLENINTFALTTKKVTSNITTIKKIEPAELRAIINNLESAPKVGGSSSCAAGCTGLCVSCTGTCTGGCTSCTSCSGCSGCSGCSSCSGTCSGNCRNGCNWCCGGSCYNCCYGCSGYCAGSCVVQCSSCVSSCSASCWQGCNNNCTATCSAGCENANTGWTHHNNPYT